MRAFAMDAPTYVCMRPQYSGCYYVTPLIITHAGPQGLLGIRLLIEPFIGLLGGSASDESGYPVNVLSISIIH